MKPYVYQRKSDNKFVGVVELDRASEKKRSRKIVYGNTEDEAWDKLNEIAYEIQTGQYIAPIKDTLLAFCVIIIRYAFQNGNEQLPNFTRCT
jgi:hypothetical protein